MLQFLGTYLIRLGNIDRQCIPVEMQNSRHYILFLSELANDWHASFQLLLQSITDSVHVTSDQRVSIFSAVRYSSYLSVLWWKIILLYCRKRFKSDHACGMEKNGLVTCLQGNSYPKLLIIWSSFSPIIRPLPGIVTYNINFFGRFKWCIQPHSVSISSTPKDCSWCTPRVTWQRVTVASIRIWRRRDMESVGDNDLMFKISLHLGIFMLHSSDLGTKILWGTRAGQTFVEVGL